MASLAASNAFLVYIAGYKAKILDVTTKNVPRAKRHRYFFPPRAKNIPSYKPYNLSEPQWI